MRLPDEPKEIAALLSREHKLAAVMLEACALYGVELKLDADFTVAGANVAEYHLTRYIAKTLRAANLTHGVLYNLHATFKLEGQESSLFTMGVSKTHDSNQTSS